MEERSDPLLYTLKQLQLDVVPVDDSIADRLLGIASTSLGASRRLADALQRSVTDELPQGALHSLEALLSQERDELIRCERCLAALLRAS